MHWTEGPDYDTVSGERHYQDTGSPETTVPATHLNALQCETGHAVEASGQTLAADAAADEAAGQRQLADAIAESDTDFSNKIQSCQWQDTNDGSPTDVSSDFNVQYVRHSLRKLMTIAIPNGGLTLTGGRAALYLRKSDASALPSDFAPEMSAYPSIWVDVGSGLELAKVDIVGGSILLERASGANFPAAAITIWGANFTFLAEDPMD